MSVEAVRRPPAITIEPVRVSLRELCLELGAGSLEDPAAQRREIAVAAVRVDVGPMPAATIAAGRGAVDGALVVRGLVLADTCLAGRTATQLVGPGDVLPLAPDAGATLPGTMAFRVAEVATLVPLDERFMALARQWPAIGGLLMRAAARQLVRGATHQAISQLSRIELRLLAIMWHLAERWGRVTPQGLALELELTHTMLGQLVGARRPTVSLALKGLAEDGTLVRRQRGWLVAHDSWRLLAEQVVSPLPSVLARSA
jgi:CRP-like cAMP-binding protein